MGHFDSSFSCISDTAMPKLNVLSPSLKHNPGEWCRSHGKTLKPYPLISHIGRMVKAEHSFFLDIHRSSLRSRFLPDSIKR